MKATVSVLFLLLLIGAARSESGHSVDIFRFTMPDAEDNVNEACCPDRDNCCPEGTTCDPKSKQCNRNINNDKSNNPIEWKVEKVDIKLKDTCPNNKTKCKDTQTCCLTKKGNYHCCKYANAVCCSDKYHCCPADTTCDLKKKRCNRNNEHPILRLLRSEKTLVQSREGVPHNNIETKRFGDEPFCPNNKTQCKATKTCCITKHGNYYCCPHKNAVCCSDKWSCCPEGTTCDVKNKKCRNSNMETNSHSMEWKIEKVDIRLKDTCPNNKTKCKDTQTCCLTKKGNYHCCKYANAVCCSDKYHCCPADTTCDLKKKRCNRNNEHPMLMLVRSEKALLQSREEVPRDNIESKRFGDEPFCPNNKTQCKATKTCCITKHGNYYCCPHKNAVCCSDKWSCCPEGTTCDVKNKKCLNSTMDLKSHSMEWKFHDQSVEEVPKNNVEAKRFGDEPFCPNNKTQCKATKTCCITKHGNYYCCPHKNAVCCSDKWSCCPEGTTCDVKHKKCLNSTLETKTHVMETVRNFDNELEPVLKKNTMAELLLTVLMKLNTNFGDFKDVCENSGKSCPMAGGMFGCCKYKEASCCPDMKTCCPDGTRCNDGKCVEI